MTKRRRPPRGLRATADSQPDQDADAESYRNGNEWALLGFSRDPIQRRSPVPSGIVA
jgi:hypothetical protein